MKDYADHPCTCGHRESSHRRVLGSCRCKGCRCPRFLNVPYVEWFRKVVKADMKLLESLKLDLLKRLNENAGRKIVVPSTRNRRTA